MSRTNIHLDPEILLADAEAYRGGDVEAGERLATALRPLLSETVESFMGRDDADRDDVVQDSTMATLSYLNGSEPFRGNPAKLAVTIARNRCRDLHRWRRIRPGTEITGMADWLASGDSSPLDEILESERLELVRRTFSFLSESCRGLLRDFYVKGHSTETLRRRLGLSTVQGVYYRRAVCLDEAKTFLQSLLHARSQGGRVGGNTSGSPVRKG
ncbi:MAG TPA: hypothetical protein P5571_11005 [Candidatus Krumholzibacteria bacterium]|nr:hypothetical protein [Candidatus Krumholzibacteria bacterium]HRX51884.1 hypothetical protein [Candidatus Krumholzibacteria bacterium]